MNTNRRKAEPQAGYLGRGQYGGLSETHFDNGTPTSYPTVFIVPQQGGNCQVRNVCQLALIDDVLGRYNAAKAAYLVGGDPADFRAMQALADDRRVLLAEIGGE